MGRDASMRVDPTPGAAECEQLMQRSVLFLNRSYWPDQEATGQLLTEMAEGLAEEFDVAVMCGQPNSIDRVAAASDWESVTRRGGVSICRVNHRKRSKTNLFLKLLGFISFAFAVRRTLRSVPSADVCIFQTDPFLLGFEALRFRRRTGCRLVGYLQDIFPDVAIAAGVTGNNLICRWLRALLFRVYRECDAMVVLSSDMRDYLIEGGVDRNRIHVVQNWADTECVRRVARGEAFRSRHGLGDHFIVQYSGNLGRTQNLLLLIDAARRLQHRADILFVMIGSGAERGRLQVAAAGAPNVRFLDFVPKDELSESLSCGDLHWLPFGRAFSKFLMPSKLYGILAAGGCPLTNASPETELYREVIEAGLGLHVEEGCAQAIVEQVLWAADNRDEIERMRAKSRIVAEEKYSRVYALAALSRILHAV